jgi:hypothetical protein
VLPMPSPLLLIDCCIVHESLKEMNYTMRNKSIKVRFSYSDFLINCLSAGLSVGPSFIKF